MSEPKLIIVSAPSGAGKTTIVRHILSLPIPVAFSVSATSRLPRSGELNGRDYYFLSPEEFKKKVEGNEFLEWEEVYHGTCYGTLKSEVDRIWQEGKSVIFDVDVVGGLNIKNIYGEKALAIFVQPPSVEALRSRLRGRSTETEEKINMRISKAEYELGFANRFDYVLVNDQLEIALDEAETIVRAFLSR
ncbi:MAG TPA: guanylate kinase [Bacteroidales bacterium]|nr:guanylate kinase [Bacteroidales bacterium]